MHSLASHADKREVEWLAMFVPSDLHQTPKKPLI